MKIQTIRQRLLHSTVIGGAALMALTAAPALTLLAMPTIASAQDFTSGVLQGEVKTTDGAPVAGATITVSQNGRAFSRTTTTDARGMFRVAGAPVGRYSVVITGEGLTEYQDENISVGLGSTSNYTFTVASTSADASTVDDVVVVGTRSAALDFERTTTGITVDVQETFNRLPIARNLTAVQLLAPQTTPGDSAFGNEVSIAGSSVAENVYYINGMNITNFRTFVGGNTVPFEFYEQVDVKTGGFQAEFGRNTGGAVVAVTRSGGDELHGGVNYYWTPNELRETARNTTTLSDGGAGNVVTAIAQKNNLDEREGRDGNVWLSGPIWKDHIYFFGFYNWRDNFQSDTNGVDTTTQTTFDDPFYGGKLDFYLNPDHRLEFTYFKDDQSNDTFTGVVGADPALTTTMTGGETTIYKYTGNLTDWLTVSAIYGENNFNQTIEGEDDGIRSVVGFAGQGTLRGNPAQLIESGIDERRLYRADADIYVPDFFGDHHFRLGVDREDLTTSTDAGFSGGLQYVYRGPTSGTQVGGRVPANTPYVRVRELRRGGAFEIEQTAMYIQDAWDVNDRLSLQLGLRTEKFDNKNVAGETFVSTGFEMSPRVGAVYDVFGDKSTRLSGFFGRYYIPIAGNTNLRMAGAELFTDDYYFYNSVGGLTRNPGETEAELILRCARDPNNNCEPGLAATPFFEVVNSPGLVSDPRSLASANLEAQYQDEFLFGLEHQLENGWRFSANLAYRDLKSVMEDFDTDYIIEKYCRSIGMGTGAGQPCDTSGNHPASVSGTNVSINSNGGYVLLNPGKDLIITVDPRRWAALGGQTITIPKEILDIPEAERTYKALELSFERPWDGTWSLQGSAVFAKSEGNIEGGVKSDNGQDDTGLTQDFDEPGWTDGSYGLLPNHRGQTFKLFGSYALTDSVTVGGNLFLQSPRHYGCIGAYPFTDERASPATMTAWYCNGRLTPRASQFKGEWSKRIDASISWRVEMPYVGELTVKADAFNLFNFSGVADYNEQGDLSLGSPNLNYRNVINYQAPRNIRIGLAYQF